MENLLPHLAMVIVVLAQSGNMVVNELAMDDGFNKYAMVVYSFALSTLILLPFAFLFNRCSAQILSYVGIDLSSATLAAALLNHIPAFTFVLALIFRMLEECEKKKRSEKRNGPAQVYGPESIDNMRYTQ